jgi:hypothetical protein
MRRRLKEVLRRDEEELDVNEDDAFYAENGPYHGSEVDLLEPDIAYE